MRLSLFLLFALLALVQSRKLTKGTQEQQFQQWMSKHNKAYATQVDYDRRFKIFTENVQKVKELNLRAQASNYTTTFGLTKFADLTSEEFSGLLGTKVTSSTKDGNSTPVAIIPNTQPPSSWDWRKHGGITPPKNEEQCGSCWAMTVAMAIESAYMIHKGKKNQVPLSVQEIIDCDVNDNGCNGGMPTTAYDYVVQNHGLTSNTIYPYQGVTGTCKKIPANEIQDPITGYELVIPPGSKNELAMASFLASNQPISTAVDASQWQFYTGGVFMASQCQQNIDHGVQIIGYDLTAPVKYWTIRNMWGTNWGEDGFIRVEYGKNACGLTSLPTAPTLP